MVRADDAEVIRFEMLEFKAAKMGNVARTLSEGPQPIWRSSKISEFWLDFGLIEALVMVCDMFSKGRASS